MTTRVVDRRQERPSGRYVTDIDRFKRRHKDEIRDHIRKRIADGSIKDFGKDGIDVPIPRKSTRQPFMHHSNKGSTTKQVLPGNKEYDPGDTIRKPQKGGGGRGNKAAPDGEGEDDFIYISLPINEVLDILFEGCELPDFLKLGGETMKRPVSRPDGFARKGPESRMDLSRTFANQRGEKFALNNVALSNTLKALKAQLEIISRYTAEKAPDLTTGKKVEIVARLNNFISRVRPGVEPAFSDEDSRMMHVLDAKLQKQLQISRAAAGWRDDQMEFRRDKDHPTPISKAVMFCLMDVSGSMGEERKALAKSFYGLLHKFLETRYEDIDVVFIRHTSDAEEVDEETFFYDQKTGGTMISSSLLKMQEIIEERYSDGSWNVYAAQSSDGGNYRDDNIKCRQILGELLPELQAYFYIEVGTDDADLWRTYEKIRDENPDKFFIQRALEPSHIVPVFKRLFSKNATAESRSQPVAWIRDLV